MGREEGKKAIENQQEKELIILKVTVKKKKKKKNRGLRPKPTSCNEHKLKY